MSRRSLSAPFAVCLAAALGVGIVLAPSGAYATGTWSTPQRLDAPTGSGEGERIGLSSSGNGVAVYSAGVTTEIYATRLVNGSWGSQTAISGTVSSPQPPQLAVASDGSAVAVWEGRDSGNVNHVWASEMSTSGTWSAPQTIDGSGCGNSCAPQVALSSGGNGVAVYLSSHAVYGVPFQSHTWGSPTLLSTAAGESASAPAVAVAGGGSGMVAWQATTATTNSIDAATYSSGSFGAEQTVESRSGSSPAAQEPQVRMTGTSTGIVAYLVWTSGSGITSIRSAAFSGSTFSSAVAAGTATHDGFSLGASADGGAVLAYSHDSGGTQHLYAETWNGSAWSSETQLDSVASQGHYWGNQQNVAAGLADSTDGWVVFASVDGSSHEHALAARLSSGSWQSPVQLDQETTTMGFSYTPSLQVLSGGAAAAAYDLNGELWGTFLSASDTPPTASFSCSTSGLSASCDGSASHDPDGTVTSSAWSWGDGTTSSGASSSHTYAHSGSYTVTLTVTDNGGQTGSASHVVAATSPGGIVPSFTIARQYANPGEAVHLDASGSTDSGGTIASYSWDFGDGASGSGVSAWHTYAAVGRYTVTLTETDSAGSVARTSQVEEIDAKNVPPTAAFTVSPATAAPGQGVAFDASATTDPDDPLSRLHFTWDLGDGTWVNGTTVTHTYTAPGTYTVTLTATDPPGGSSSVTHAVAVVGSPDFTATPDPTEPRLPVAFTGEGPAASPATRWNFGDGATSTGAGARHAYAATGTYAVTLTVTDTAGTQTVTHDVVVENGPIPSFTWTPAPPEETQAASFAGTAVPRFGPPRLTKIVDWSWDFGDGGAAAGRRPTHTFATPGTYRVTLTVTDASGHSGIATLDVVVAPGVVVAVDEGVGLSDAAGVTPPVIVDVGEGVGVGDSVEIPTPALVDVDAVLGVSDNPTFTVRLPKNRRRKP